MTMKIPAAVLTAACVLSAVPARAQGKLNVVAATEDLASIGNALRQEFPATDRDRTLRVALLRDRMLGNAGKSLWLLMGASCMFLLIGCANVANLLLARGVARQREIAVRIALGAAKRHIIRQLLTESLVLATLGGMGGYALTYLGLLPRARIGECSLSLLGLQCLLAFSSAWFLRSVRGQFQQPRLTTLAPWAELQANTSELTDHWCLRKSQ